MKSIKSFFFTDIVFVNKLWIYFKYLILTKNKAEIKKICDEISVGELTDEVLNDDDRLKIITYYRMISGGVRYDIPTSFYETDYFKELADDNNMSKLFNAVFLNPTVDISDVRCIYKDYFEQRILKNSNYIKESSIIPKSDFVNGLASFLDDTDIHVEVTLHDNDDIQSLIDILKDRRSSNITVNVILTFMSNIDLVNELIKIKKINVIDTRIQQN